jgi:hypothetical protein
MHPLHQLMPREPVTQAPSRPFFFDSIGQKRTSCLSEIDVRFAPDCVAKLPSGNGLPPMIAGIVGYQVK